LKRDGSERTIGAAMQGSMMAADPGRSDDGIDAFRFRRVREKPFYAAAKCFRR
jgi:hypothetical protein